VNWAAVLVSGVVAIKDLANTRAGLAFMVMAFCGFVFFYALMPAINRMGQDLAVMRDSLQDTRLVVTQLSEIRRLILARCPEQACDVKDNNE
jgi:hypothetical protein